MLWSMNKSRKNHWIAGDVMSWVLGVLLGGFLGTVLLIATPIMLRKAAAPATTTASAAPATTTPAASTPAARKPAESTPAATPAAPEPAETAPAGAALTGNAEAGKALYATCAACHGQKAEGGVVGPSLIAAGGPTEWTPAQFALAVREGKSPTKELLPTMPRQPQLTDQNLADLQALLNTLK